MDPWNTPAGACIPTWPATPSSRIVTKCRGVATVGTAGYGWVVVYPWSMAASDAAAVWYTGASYTGSTFAGSTTTGVTSTSPNSPFTTSTIGDNSAIYRLVACGVRMRYTGSELNRGGRAIAICHPAHSTLDSMAFSDVEAYENIMSRPITNDWVCAVHQPISTPEVNFVASTSGHADYLGVMVQAVAGVGFEFDVYAHLEFTGATVVGKQPGLVDEVGFGRASAISAALPNRASDSIVNGRSGGSSTLNTLMDRGSLDNLAEAAQSVFRIAAPLVRSVFL